MADFTQKQYLDFDGLTKYDELMKDHVAVEKGKVLDLIALNYPSKQEFNQEVTARQNADNKHTADIGTNATNIKNLT